jgi:hypothetical protein
MYTAADSVIDSDSGFAPGGQYVCAALSIGWVQFAAALVCLLHRTAPPTTSAVC